jgi:NADH-quinone oxidoreductase subunit A
VVARAGGKAGWVPENWLFIGIFLAVTTVMGIGLLLLGGLLRPNRPTAPKSASYESGVPTLYGDARARYSARFYIIAVLFVLFDIEVIFIFPWAVAFDAVGVYGLVGMLVFIALLLVGYVHAWRKGAFEWV